MMFQRPSIVFLFMATILFNGIQSFFFRKKTVSIFIFPSAAMHRCIYLLPIPESLYMIKRSLKSLDNVSPMEDLFLTYLSD
jgi:hypothetical protein